MPDRKLPLATPTARSSPGAGPPLMVPFGVSDPRVTDPETIRLATVCTRQQEVIADLLHQLRTLIALTRAMVDQTLREPAPLTAARAALEARIGGLALAHTNRVTSLGKTAALRRTVSLALAPYGFDDRSTRFHMRGPPVHLDAGRTLCLFVVLTELAANAARHGALGAADGRVDLTWRVVRTKGPRRVRLCWAERDGPPATLAREGSGLRLIRSAMALEPGGGVAFRCDPTGLQCRLDLPALPVRRPADTR